MSNQHDGPRDQTLATPWPWIRRVEAAIGRPLETDVCAMPDTAKAPRFYTEVDDGLSSPWPGLCWCNPPFNDIARWVWRALDQWRSNPLNHGTVFVVPSNRTEQGWFQRLRELERRGSAWSAYPAERINYEGAASSAPFPSMFWAIGPTWLCGIRSLEGARLEEPVQTLDLFAEVQP